MDIKKYNKEMKTHQVEKNHIEDKLFQWSQSEHGRKKRVPHILTLMERK